MSSEVLLDLTFLTEEERDLISNVLSKDAEVRKQEQNRINSLRKELDSLKENGIPEDEIESKNDKYCARCQTYFGIILNRGAFCPRCELKVCKDCRVNDADVGWICTLCQKVREVKAQSGAWFFQGHKQKKGKLFGSMLVRQSLRRLPGSWSPHQKEEEIPSRYVSPKEADGGLSPFTEVNHVRSSERPPRQPDINSNQAQRSGGRQMGYQYSDESDVESEQGSHDGSVEDNVSEKTPSKDTDATRMPSQDEQEETGVEYFGLKVDTQKPDDEKETPWGAEASPVEEILEPKQDTRPTSEELEPYSSEASVVQPAHEEESCFFGSRESALRAFSETFVSVNLGLKPGESREGPETSDDPNSHMKLDGDMSLDTYENSENRGNQVFPEVHACLEDRANEGAREDREYLEDNGNRENYGRDRDYHEDQPASEGPDSRRSSDLHYEGFHADNESMISETSGYGTPTASEDTSSKRTPSISGDEGRNTPVEDTSLQRRTSEGTPVIVTTDVGDDSRRQRRWENNSPRNSSVADFEEDLDVSFSKFGGGLGNRMLKDQLSMGSRESIVSYYSNAGGEVYGKYPVSGEVLFGIKYDPKIQEFQIQVHQAKDITAVNKKTNTSDPYVKTYLLPDRSRTGKRKSKMKRNTVNPVFDEILTYKISYDEILQRTLWLAIWNHDTFGHNDFLGEVLVPIDEYQQSGFSLEDPEPQWYELCERQQEDPQFAYNGEIVFSLKYVPPSAVVSSKKKKKKKKAEEEKGELHINIIEASNLLAKDANGFSDPFCKCYLLPDKSKKSKQKTPVVKKSLNPKWNYHFVYDNVTHEELMDRVLELTIWDFDRGSSNEFLGGVRLGLGAGLQEWDDANSDEQAAWNRMLNNQNDWNQVTLTLRDHMGSHQ